MISVWRVKTWNESDAGKDSKKWRIRVSADGDWLTVIEGKTGHDSPVKCNRYIVANIKYMSYVGI